MLIAERYFPNSATDDVHPGAPDSPLRPVEKGPLLAMIQGIGSDGIGALKILNYSTVPSLTKRGEGRFSSVRLVARRRPCGTRPHLAVRGGNPPLRLLPPLKIDGSEGKKRSAVRKIAVSTQRSGKKRSAGRESAVSSELTAES